MSDRHELAPHPSGSADTSRSRRGLVLDITRVWNGLRVALLEETPEGALPRGYEHVQVEFDELDRIVGDLHFLLRRSHLVGQLGDAAGDEVLRLSMLLFDVLVPPSLKTVLRRGQGALVLRIDDSLQHVPWELLHNGEAFMSRQYALSRMLVVHGIHEPPPRRPYPGCRRLLVLADPRADLPAANREGMLLRNVFADRLDVELAYLGAPITRGTLRENLREFDVLHFAGHGEWDEHGGGWLMADGRFEPQDVRRLEGTRPMPSLVFANACSSGATRRAAEDGMVGALLRAGVRHYLGTMWDIPDDIGILFAVGVYGRLAEGRAIGEAVRQTRLELAERFGDGTVLWGSYVLYGPPDERYFGLPEPAGDTTPVRPQTRDSLGALGTAAMPGQRVIHLRPAPPRTMARPSPIAPNAAMRGAEAMAPSTLRAHVSRVERAAIGSIVLSALLVAVIALTVYLGRSDHGADRRSDGVASARGVLAMQSGQASQPGPEDADAPVPLRADLSVVAQLHDSHGTLREVPLSQGDRLHSGDRVGVRFVTSRDAHAYVIFVNSRRRPQLLFPTVDGDVGEVSAGARVVLPDQGTWYVLDDEPGTNLFVLAVSERPIQAMSTLLSDIGELLHEAPAAATGVSTGLRQMPLDLARARIERAGARVTMFAIDHVQ